MFDLKPAPSIIRPITCSIAKAEGIATFQPVAPDGSPWYLSGPAPYHLLTCSACGETFRTSLQPTDS